METKQGVVVACPACGARNRVLYSRLGGKARCGSCHGELPAPAEPLAVDRESELETLLKEAGLPVLVDFWAPWCGPCRAVAPEVGKVAQRNAGRLLVVKANTEADPEIGPAHRVQAIPTMALFRGGRELARASGARPAAAIEGFVQQALQAGG
jgi:thioredoxin 2